MNERTKLSTPSPRRRRTMPGTSVFRPIAEAVPTVASRAVISDFPLILGGHSFIGPLGREAEATADEKREVFANCLAQGIHVFDTTYAAERVEFGRVALACSADDAVRVRPIIWNFFGPLTDPLPSPSPWTEARWDEAMAELAIPCKPIVVLHEVGDEEADRAQVATVLQWKRAGRVAALGLWPAASLEGWADDAVANVDFVVAPWNVGSAAKTRPIIEAARQCGLTTVGTSPFTRGWEVDRLAKRLAVLEQRPIADARARVADALLRFAVYSPEVDHVVVAMRAPAYVASNVASLRRGPLSAREERWIEGLGRTMPLKYHR